MDKEAIRATLAKKFGNVKCMNSGGAVDDDEEDDAPDDVSQSSESPPAEPVEAAAAADPQADKAPAEAAPAPAPLSDADKAKQTSDYLSAKYSQAADPTALKQALANQSNQNTIANIGQALAGIAGAGGAGAGYKQDTSVFDHQRQQAAQNVQNQSGLREQNIQDFLRKQAIQSQVTQNMREQGSYEQKLAAEKLSLKQAQNSEDPNSQTSKQAVALAKAQFPKIFNGMSPGQIASLTYSDIKNVGLPATEAAARDAATVEATRGRLQQGLAMKNQAMDSAFVGNFGKMQQKYNATQTDFDQIDAALDQAASGNGIAGNLAKAGALHDALRRVTQNELSMGQDPSIMNRMQSMYQKASDGQSLTDKDIAEFRQINAANRAAASKGFQLNAEQTTSSHDRVSGRPAGYAAALVGWKGAQPAQEAAVSGQPAPHGNTVTQGGVTFTWNGQKYMPTTTVGAK